jgi:hypothetical protein
MGSVEALKIAHKAIDKFAVEVIRELFTNATFISIDDYRPLDGQPCWVRHRNGAEYRMTYPFNHKDYPLWYPLPTYCEDDYNSTSSE